MLTQLSLYQLNFFLVARVGPHICGPHAAASTRLPKSAIVRGVGVITHDNKTCAGFCFDPMVITVVG